MIKASKILLIIGIVISAFLVFIFSISGFMSIIAANEFTKMSLQQFASSLTQDTIDMIMKQGISVEQYKQIITDTSLAVGIVLVVFFVLSIVSIVFEGIALSGLSKATKRDGMTKYGVFAIVAGAISSGLPIVSGILILCSKDFHYTNK